MGFLGLFGGAPKWEKQQQQNTFGDLGGLFKSLNSTGSDLTNKGEQTQGAATSFFGKTVAGDRTAVAPAVNAAVDAGDAANREEAQMGTSRGGGTNADHQQIEAHTRAMIASLLGQNQENAAEGLANIGGQDIGAGLGAQEGAGSIGLGTNAQLTSDINNKNASAAKMWGSLIGGAIKLGTKIFAPTPV